jgi:hypothetical protein
MVADFAPELLLHIFQFLPLKSLLAAKAVNRKWNALVPTCRMTPERGELYKLYHTAITSPKFLDSRQCVLSTIHEFDREAYVAMLEGQDGGGTIGRDRTLPAEFRCYILEWPQKAVFGHIWPGMDNDFTPTLANKPYGANSLSDTGRISELSLFYEKSTSPYPTVCEANVDEFLRNKMDHPAGDVVSVNALKVWYYGYATHSWLVVDKERGRLHGSVGVMDQEWGWETDWLVRATSWVQHMKLVLNS